MIVGMIGFILVGFFLYAAMAPSDGNNSGSSSSTFFVGVLIHPATAEVISVAAEIVAAAVMAAAVKTRGLPFLSSARTLRLYAVLAAVSRVCSSHLTSSFIHHLTPNTPSSIQLFNQTSDWE